MGLGRQREQVTLNAALEVDGNYMPGRIDLDQAPLQANPSDSCAWCHPKHYLSAIKETVWQPANAYPCAC